MARQASANRSPGTEHRPHVTPPSFNSLSPEARDTGGRRP
ncbi:hypothetical protein YUYDRAFT_02278 [Streptomyces sp. ScaeMP-e48]|nr:hypothetical protein YUYDRAFT_02278 [Streptomyces sp. ScaeMP-e48]